MVGDRKEFLNYLLLINERENMDNDRIVLFKPYLSEAAKNATRQTMDSRFIGQGPKVDKFEQLFEQEISHNHKAIAVSSGTASLHLAYILAGIKEGDEVVGPVFSCLHKNATILLENGKRVSIRKIVKEKYSGKVISFNLRTFKLEAKKITNWYKNYIGNRELIRLYFNNANNNRLGHKSGIWVTTDHRVLTPKGYIEAGRLKTGDLVYINEYKLNKNQNKLLLGMLLGDGAISLSIRNKNDGKCRLYIGHTEKQKEYIDLKKKALADFGLKYEFIPYRKASNSKPFIRVRSSFGIQWKLIRKRFYKDSKRIIPNDLNKDDFNALTLAVWYMDDGALNGGKSYRGNGSAIICTDRYSLPEVKRLNKILHQLGLKSNIQTLKKNNKVVYHLYIGNGQYKNLHNSAKVFFSIIAPYVPTSMRYKLPKDIKRKYPFDKSLWDLGNVEPFYDKVYVDDKYKPDDGYKKNAYVYCIDVKDNHNFISNGFILHNCAASYSPALYERAKVTFCDIEKDSLNIDCDHLEEVFKQRGERIKAIVVVDYGGYPVRLDRVLKIARKWNVPVIEDAAQAIGAKYKGKNIGETANFCCFSFQSIKTLTTVDGGMLTLEDPLLEEKAKRLRWFGIDRKAKHEDRWKKDIWEIGFKYQLSDVYASLGIEGLKEVETLIEGAKKRFQAYQEGLKNIPGIKMLNTNIEEGVEPGYWLCTVNVEKREDLKRKLLENNIESDPTHYRIDRYTVFGGRVYNCPNMDYLEDRYLLLPMHYYVSLEDITERIIPVIKGGW
ncbi:MAG: DegT/DnrJ/EryC1/StrS family aminotransferase [Actinomycetota bacterium]